MSDGACHAGFASQRFTNDECGAATNEGVILGTAAAYMSPEQAKGRNLDRRTDIWAFGCVLYEMLSGRRAFDGDDAADILAAILTRDPDWTQLPSPVSTLLARWTAFSV